MQGAPMISYAQNREDVVLRRALREVDKGRYAEIGVRSRQSRSMTRVLSEQGWNGLVVLTEEDEAASWRAARPRDTVETAHTSDELAAAVERAARQSSVLGDLHLLVLDETALAAVLTDDRLQHLAPWVLVVAGPAAETADGVRDAGYRPCLFDGVSRFYVAGQRAELTDALSYPACSRDDFIDLQEHELREEVAALRLGVEEARDANVAEMLRWRHAAVSAWATTAAARNGTSTDEVHHLRSALATAQQDSAAVRQTLSWRVTKPLRAVRSAGRRS